MKKYLVKGALALFGGALMFSCAEKESEYVPLAQQKVKAFEEVFKEIYGDIDPYQDWGFSSGKINVDPTDPSQVVEVVDLGDDVAVTRAAAFGGALTRGARTRGKSTTDPYCDTEGKFWYDNYGYTPPAKVTEAERAKVLDEFNKVHTDRGVSINFTDYFVQQVYSCKNDETHHKYKSFPGQNGDHERQYKKAWEHMDKLLCGLKDTHSNNFNANGTTEIETWDGKTLGGGDGKQKVVEKDSIQLMVNCDTKRFGYHNSLDSKDHYEYIILEIDGAYYVGFDFCASYSFKTKNDDGSFVKSDYDQDPGEEYDANFNGYTPRSGNEIKYNSDGTIKGYEGGDKDIHRDHIYNDWIIKITPALVEEPEPVIDYTYPEYEDQEWEQIESGRVFCEDLGQATREDLDFNDLVFDAIIFKKVATKTRWKVRREDGVKKDSVEIKGLYEGVTYPKETTSYYANVELLAAGGTIPVTIESNKPGGTSYQVHDLFGEGITTMINTRDNNSTAFGSFASCKSVQLGGEKKNFVAKLSDGNTKSYNFSIFEIDYPADGKAIEKIKIYTNFDKDQQFQELESIRGKAPRKFMAPIGTNWTSERKNISLAYPKFGEWVSDGVVPWGTVNPDYTYSGSYSPSGLKLPLVMKARRTYAVGTENEIWSGENTFGTTWNLSNVKANHPLSSSTSVKFFPGDRLRFYGTKIKEDAWITVLIGGISPYFIDSEFPNYKLDSSGNKQMLSSDDTSCIEVVLDEWSAGLFNEQLKNNGSLSFQVQGRNFTLTSICRVVFD